MLKTFVICGYIAHKIWWKRQHRTRIVKRGSRDWQRIVPAKVGGQ